MTKKHNLYIDIFAGCGGLSVGLLKAGWTGFFAIEKNQDAFSTLEHNLIKKNPHFLWPEWLEIKEYDINELIKEHENELRKLQGKINLVAGGPPCQGFSMAGKRDKNDQRNLLVKSYIKFIKLVLPEAIIFENVHGFTVNFRGENGIKKYSSYVENELKGLGYKTSYKIIDMSEYCIPQKRKRFILVAMKNHAPEKVFSLLENNRDNFCDFYGIKRETRVYDAISDLEKQFGICDSQDTRGFKAGMYGIAQSGYEKLMRQGIDNFDEQVDSHRFVNHRKETVILHENLLKHAPVGKRITPDNNTVMGLKRRGVTVLDRASQAPTITSIPDELIHYCEPRILTVREHARLQSFPDWFEFKGKYTSGGKRRKKEVPRYTQVGNAIPPLFAEQIGIALMEVLKNEPKE